MSEYGDEELLERLDNFDSDSIYEVGLIKAAAARIRALLQDIDALDCDMRDMIRDD